MIEKSWAEFWKCKQLTFWIFEFPQFKQLCDAHEVEIQWKPSSFRRTERQAHKHTHMHTCHKSIHLSEISRCFPEHGDGTMDSVKLGQFLWRSP